jgi:hypothetical protein
MFTDPVAFVGCLRNLNAGIHNFEQGLRGKDWQARVARPDPTDLPAVKLGAVRALGVLLAGLGLANLAAFIL